MKKFLTIGCFWKTSIALFFLTVVVGDRQISAAQVEGATDQQNDAQPIKVMSFNIRYGSANDGENRWDNRSDLVVETIKLFDPDLFGGQEVLKFQAEFLRKEFPDYGFHGVGRDDGKGKGEIVPVMYKKNRFQQTDSGHFWLSKTPEVVGSKSWDSSLPRMVSWVQLTDRRNQDAKLVFMNAHFDHRGTVARVESARLIRKRAEAFLNNSIPLILTGDFNTTEDGEPYAEFGF